MKRVSFHQQAFKDFAGWGQTDRKVQAKIAALILDTLRDPFTAWGSLSLSSTIFAAAGRAGSMRSTGWFTR